MFPISMLAFPFLKTYLATHQSSEELVSWKAFSHGGLTDPRRVVKRRGGSDWVRYTGPLCTSTLLSVCVVLLLAYDCVCVLLLAVGESQLISSTDLESSHYKGKNISFILFEMNKLLKPIAHTLIYGGRPMQMCYNGPKIFSKTQMKKHPVQH